MNETKQERSGVSAIVPARNEEAVIAACVESLAVQEVIREVLVVNDQSTDRTAEVVRNLIGQYAKVRLIEAGDLPAGWVGKNHAVWLGAKAAIGEWLLFTDADSVHETNSAKRALGIAAENGAAMVSFSPEQIMETWYEKALIPYVYCRLGSRFSYLEVNDPPNKAAAANGQFLMVRRDAYDAVGGHASIAAQLLEDVALATRVKSAGWPIWFGSGKGIVRVRMYRSFGAMWQGWRKNLYPLIGGTLAALESEFVRAIVPVGATVIATITFTALTGRWMNGLAVLLAGCAGIFVVYDGELRRNGFAPGLNWYGIPGRVLFGAVLLASKRGYRRGKLQWKGREYPRGGPGASNR